MKLPITVFHLLISINRAMAFTAGTRRYYHQWFTNSIKSYCKSNQQHRNTYRSMIYGLQHKQHGKIIGISSLSNTDGHPLSASSNDSTNVPSSSTQQSVATTTGNTESINIADDSIMMIPSMEQLQTDPFIKQVQYAEFVIGLIYEDNGRETDVLMKRLRAQLSHPDGIRGFMVSFLTSYIPISNNNNDMNTNKDATGSNSNSSINTSYSTNDMIPKSVIHVILELVDPIHDSNELLSLMCMNIIMPTAMITKQPTNEMKEQSIYTARRATNVVASILTTCRCTSNDDNDHHHRLMLIYNAIVTQCHAIITAATQLKDTMLNFGNDSHADTYNTTTSNNNNNDIDVVHVNFWKEFMIKWKYTSEQLSDIIEAIQKTIQQV